MMKKAGSVLALNAADNERTGAAILALNSVVDRLERILTEENAILEAGRLASHERFLVHKSQILHEFTALQQSLSDHRVYSKMSSRLQSIRGLAERNHALLRSQAEGFAQFMKITSDAAKD